MYLDNRDCVNFFKKKYTKVKGKLALNFLDDVTCIKLSMNDSLNV